MNVMMSDHISEEEWPQLGKIGRDDAGEQKPGWELLMSDTKTDSAPNTTNTFDGAVIVETPERRLSHSFSTPNFHHVSVLDTVHEDGGGNDEGEDFRVVSRPPSVTTWSGAPPLSFSEATRCSTPPTPSTITPSTKISTPPRRMIKPKFVVTPIKRCTKSTGDLPRMIREEDEDCNYVRGFAMEEEYQHRKIAGARSRAGGLKCRPDEMKRKQFSLAKKARQRAASKGRQ